MDIRFYYNLMASNAGIIIYNVKHKEHGDHDVKMLAQVHMTKSGLRRAAQGIPFSH